MDFFDATFIGSKKSDCVSGGACWVFVNVWFERFIYGLYPAEEIWRINLAFGILAASILVYNFVNQKIRKYILIFLFGVFPFISLFLFHGGALGLPVVDTREWGGLFFTLVISVFAIIFLFSIGYNFGHGQKKYSPSLQVFLNRFH